MKRILQTMMGICHVAVLLAALGFGLNANANEGGFPLDKAPERVSSNASLQNGAKLFVNYCLNCHSASYMRFNRLKDIGLSEQQIKDNLLFTTDKVGDTMNITMNPRQAKDWFGGTPPDLTVIARSRSGHGGTGTDYLYTYLRTYYRDGAKATGWNNMVFPNVGMPHVLHELQGERRPVFETIQAHGHETHVLKGWEQVKPGTMTAKQYDEAVADLVNYMQWMAEPAQNTRVRVGVWVMLFLVGFMILAWRLNASYWKDVR